MIRKIRLFFPDGTTAGFVIFDGEVSKVYQEQDGRRVFLFQVKGRFPPPRADFSWVERVLDQGLEDGRKRFILYVGSRYLVNVKGLEEDDALEALRAFYERGGGKVYDAWLRSVIRGVKSRKLKPWSLSRLKRDDPELYESIMEVLRTSGRSSMRKDQ
jgi:hypothetical protein